MISSTFASLFKSYYLKSTYLFPVDLSQTRAYRISTEVKELLQLLVSPPEVRKILSNPLSQNPKNILSNNSILQKHGFSLLTSIPQQKKIPCYTVIEHPSVANFVIKSGAGREVPETTSCRLTNSIHETVTYTKQDIFFSIAFHNRIDKIIAHNKTRLALPREQVLSYEKSETTQDICKKCFLIQEKFDVLSTEQTIQAIKKMSSSEQQTLAKQLSILVKKSGLINATFNNIRFHKEGSLVLLDLKPYGLFAEKHECNSSCKSFCRKFKYSKGESLQKCARIGLFNLLNQTSKVTEENFFPSSSINTECEPGLEAFRKEVLIHYNSSFEYSKTKIVLSIASLGIIPLIYAITALVKIVLFKQK